MQDLFFENELKRRIKTTIVDDVIKRLFEDSNHFFRNENYVDNSTKIDVLQDFDEVLFDYYYSELGYGDSEEELDRYYDSGYDIFDEKVEPYISSFSEDNLKRMYENHRFSKKERDFIMYSNFTKKWRGVEDQYRQYFQDTPERCAITDVLLREKLFQDFGKDGIEKIKKILENEKYSSGRLLKTRNHFLSLLSDTPFDQISDKEIEEEIEKKTLATFNSDINCGGYALEVDQWIEPIQGDHSNENVFSKNISTILERYPFVRLLGDESLADDEYLVIYRKTETPVSLYGSNFIRYGHHFIRVDSDGTVREKDGNGVPKKFESWEDCYKDGKDVLFAVKKDHKMFDYDFQKVVGLDFNQTVLRAIEEKRNSFSYHNHEFCLKKSQDGDIIVISEDGEKVVADVAIEDDECITVIKDGMEQYVENFSGKIKPIIKDGKLVNLDEFRKNDKNKDNMEGR